jgi:hypothetical protein
MSRSAGFFAVGAYTAPVHAKFAESSGDRARAALDESPNDERQSDDHHEVNETSRNLETEPENGPGHDKNNA